MVFYKNKTQLEVSLSSQLPYHIKTFYICFVLCLLHCQVVSKEYGCVWYGICNVDQRHQQYCPYTGPAKQITNSTSLHIINKWCPHMSAGKDQVHLCCDDAQLEVIDRHFKMAANFLSRCPSCLYNFLSHMCEFSCSPNQSLYIDVTDTAVTNLNKTVITGIDIRISEEYMWRTYNSCVGVSVPSTGQRALDLMCGSWGASRCSPYKWFKYIGDPNLNSYVPFKINYLHFSSQELYLYKDKVLNPKTTPCNMPANSLSSACNCMDCEESCPIAPFPPSTEKPCKRLGINCFYLVMAAVFISLSTVFVIVLYLQDTMRRPSKTSLLVLRTTLDNDRNSTDQRFGVNKQAIAVDDDETSPLQAKQSSTSSNVVTDNAEDLNYVTSKSASFCERLGGELDKLLQEAFERLGLSCALHPFRTLCIGICVVLVLGHGILYLHLTTDPVELWASPTSRSRQEKTFFDTHFEPFYRTEQVIINAVGLKSFIHNTSNGPIEFGPVFHKDFLLEVLKLQEQIELLGHEDGNGLEKICYAPLTSPFTGPTLVAQCVIQSIWGYYSNDLDEFNEVSSDGNFTVNYLDHFIKCSQNSYSPECLAPYGGPIDPAIALGGFLKSGESLSKTAPYEKATAVILTFLVNNYHNKTKLHPALLWEDRFISFMKNWTRKTPSIIDVAFTSEKSIEDELDKESRSDIITIFGSYVLMFAYIALALGQINSFNTLLMDSKITLGLAGVLVVLASVVCSIGFYGFVGVPATLIIFEVIPFLVLAVGVDNIFILVRRHQREPKLEGETTEQHVARVLGLVGPSMLLTSVSESCCFFLGGLSDMPAIKAFALYAAMALFMDFLFQISCFVSILTLDTKRQEGHRLDIFCWLQCPKKEATSVEEETLFNICCKMYVKLLLKNYSRAIVVIVFLAWLCVSLSVLPSITIGLDQDLAMPPDSHVHKYFKYLNEFLSIGPPVYFVLVGDLDMSSTAVQNMICGGQYCNADSLSSQIYMASRQPEHSYISRPASSWMDDYFDWVAAEDCCMFFSNNDSFCPHTLSYECEFCEKYFTLNASRPDASTFKKYLSFFLQDNPDSLCAKAGHAAYSQAVKYKLDENNDTIVETTCFMAFHTILKTSKDYYKAIQEARTVADNITNMLNSNIQKAGVTKTVHVFPYSIFYVFFEQYLTMWSDTLKSIGISLSTVFLVTFCLIGLDLVLSLIVVTTITMIIINLGGLMYFWDITLNAVSLVNLVMAIGISVEFCSHIVHSFSNSSKETRSQRAADALLNMGSSVFSGIALTKFSGIIVLGFAHSQIFKVFYYQMYLGIVLLGVAHGLFLLPVLLSYFGSPMNKWKVMVQKRENRLKALRDGEGHVLAEVKPDA